MQPDRRALLASALLSLAGPARAQVQVQHAPRGAVGIDGGRILLDGRPTTLFGFRVGSAPLRDDWTEALIGQLDLWRAHGINALILWLQGTSGGYTRVFTADGSLETGRAPVLARTDFAAAEGLAENGATTGPEVIARTRRIIAACGQRGMAAIVGVFYRSALLPTDTPAILAVAAATAAREIGPHPNLMFNVFNEAQTDRRLEAVADLRTYAAAVKAALPGAIVGAGSLRAPMTPAIAGLPEVDVVMQDAGNTLAEATAVLDDLRARTPKPVMNVESFEGYGGGMSDDLTMTAAPPPGYTVDFPRFRRVFGAFAEADERNPLVPRHVAGRTAYRGLVDHVAQDAERRTHLMIHLPAWFQGASRVARPGQVGRLGEPGYWNNAFHPGFGSADGTVANPGIRWILEHVRQRAG